MTECIYQYIESRESRTVQLCWWTLGSDKDGVVFLRVFLRANFRFLRLYWHGEAYIHVPDRGKLGTICCCLRKVGLSSDLTDNTLLWWFWWW